MSVTTFAAPYQEASVGSDLFVGLMDAFLPQIPLTDIHDVLQDVPPAGREISLVNKVDDITGGEGCNSTDTGEGQLVLTKRQITPVPFRVVKGQCIVDLRTASGWQREWDRVRPRHLENNSAFVDFVGRFYAAGHTLDLMRYAWLGDTAAAIESGGGYFKASLSTNLAKYNRLDGYWKKIIAAGASISRVTLSKNALLTTALQCAYTAAEMIAFLQQAKRQADPRMKRNKADNFFLVTNNWYSTIEAYYESTKLTAVGVAEGPMGLTVGGVRLIPVPFWDEYIGNTDFTGDTSTASGAAKYYPNRFIFGIKEAFIMAPAYNPETPVFDVEYNPEDKDIDFIAETMLDVQLGNYSYLVAGY